MRVCATCDYYCMINPSELSGFCSLWHNDGNVLLYAEHEACPYHSKTLKEKENSDGKKV